MANPVIEIIEAELERFGVPQAAVNYGSGGRHPYVYVTGPNKAGFIPYSARAHGRGLLNFRADMRKFLVRLGFSPTNKSTGASTSVGDAIVDKLATSRALKNENEFGAAVVVPNEKEIERTVGKAPNPLECELPRISAIPNEAQATTHRHDGPLPVKKESKKTMANGSKADGRQAHLTNVEVAQVTMLIANNAKIDTAKRICDYNPSWSDERVMRIIAVGDRTHISEEAIRKLRLQIFGRTPQEQKSVEEARSFTGGGMGAMWGRISDLERRVQALEDATTAPGQRDAKDHQSHARSS